MQILATPYEDSICAIWDELAAESPELSDQAERSVRRVTSGGDLVFRLRAGALADRAEADAFCARLKAKGHDCFSVRR